MPKISFIASCFDTYLGLTQPPIYIVFQYHLNGGLGDIYLANLSRAVAWALLSLAVCNAVQFTICSGHIIYYERCGDSQYQI